MSHACRRRVPESASAFCGFARAQPPVRLLGIWAVNSLVCFCVCACVCVRARACARFLPQHCYLGRRQTRNRWAITWTELTDVYPLR